MKWNIWVVSKRDKKKLSLKKDKNKRDVKED
jgi:hypothetical protein